MKTGISPLFIFLILAGLNGSCRGVPPEGIAPTPSVSAPSATVPPATPTPATATKTPVARIDSTCWPIKPLQKSERINGSLVFGDDVQHAFAWDIKSFRVQPIEASPSLSISPNGESIAELPWSKSTLTLISPENITSFPLPESEYAGIQYLPDGRILIGTGENILDSYKEGVGITDKFYIFNSASGEITAHSIFLPDFWLPLPQVVAIQYSQDLNYVVYRTSPGGDSQPRFILLDVNNNDVIWAGPKVDTNMAGNRAGMPVWLPDSSGLIYSWTNETDGENLYFISLTGEVTKLTFFKNAEISGVNSVQLPLPSWSPDGRYLVFGVKLADQDIHKRWFHLYIWDNREKRAYKPCLPNEDNILDIYRVTWSFDSAHLAMQLPYGTGDITSLEGAQSLGDHSTIVILDLNNRTIFELPDENSRGEYTTLYGDKVVGLLGWVNWEIP